MKMNRRIFISNLMRLSPVRLDAGAHTLPIPQFKSVSLFEALIVTAVRTETGQGQVHSSVELKFLKGNLENLSTLLITLLVMLALDDFVGICRFALLVQNRDNFDRVWLVLNSLNGFQNSLTKIIPHRTKKREN